MKNNPVVFFLFIIIGLLFGILLYIDSTNYFLTLFQMILGSLFVLLFPGYSLLPIIFSKKESLDTIEILALSFVFSIVVITLLVMIMTLVSFPITKLSVFILPFIVPLLSVMYNYGSKKYTS